MASSRQLDHWRGDFGDAYVDRNGIPPELKRQRVRFWASILGRLQGGAPLSFLEVGANVDVNLAALRILTSADIWTIEPNDKARGLLIESGITTADRALAGA